MAKYNWWQWSSVAQGSAKPGSPVTIARDGERFAAFIADNSGSVYNIAGTPGSWGDWASVSQGQTIPGGWIESGWDGQAFQLFLADPGGGVYTIRGTPDQGWGLWNSVSQGSTKPGAQVTAGWDGQAFQLFLADPGGGIYTARGTAAQGWGPWSSVSQGSTTPGAPVTAVWDGKAFQLFLADPGGAIYTARGTGAQGWGPWTWVSQGRSTPGAPVTAVWEGNAFQLFLADPNGGIYTARGNPSAGWGPWMSISDGRTTPGERVTAVWDGKQFAVIVADPGGGVFAAFGAGTAEDGWTPWSSVAQGSTVPGAPVTAFWNYNGSQMALFLTDPNGGVYTIGTRGPDAPSNLHGVSVTDSTINIAWTDDNGDFDGFRVLYAQPVLGAETKTLTLPQGARTGTIPSLPPNTPYNINVVAFNDATGESPPSNDLFASTVAAPTPPASISASVQQLATEGFPYALIVNGSNFESGETVSLSIVWTLGDTATFPGTVAATSLGAFTYQFFGNVGAGLCAGDDPNTSEQTFQVQAMGLTSKKNATATARFACP
jgi:Fibronectin type III domain